MPLKLFDIVLLMLILSVLQNPSHGMLKRNKTRIPSTEYLFRTKRYSRNSVGCRIEFFKDGNFGGASISAEGSSANVAIKSRSIKIAGPCSWEVFDRSEFDYDGKNRVLTENSVHRRFKTLDSIRSARPLSPRRTTFIRWG